MRLYLANKMRMKPLYNFQWFEDTKWDLIEQGHDVVSPHDIDIAQHYVRIDAAIPNGDGRRKFLSVELTVEFNEKDALLRDFAALLTCDGIVLGEDWRNSFGALCEGFVAATTGRDIYEWYDGELSRTYLVPNAFVNGLQFLDRKMRKVTA